MNDTEFKETVEELLRDKKTSEEIRNYKGVKYWNIIGIVNETKVVGGFPTVIAKTVIMRKVHWIRLAFYGPDVLLRDHFGEAPVDGSVNWVPHYDLPKLTEKVEEDLNKIGGKEN